MTKLLTTLLVTLAIVPAAFAGCKSGACGKKKITRSIELNCQSCTKCKGDCSL